MTDFITDLWSRFKGSYRGKDCGRSKSKNTSRDRDYIREGNYREGFDTKLQDSNEEEVSFMSSQKGKGQGSTH